VRQVYRFWPIAGAFLLLVAICAFFLLRVKTSLKTEEVDARCFLAIQLASSNKFIEKNISNDSASLFEEVSFYLVGRIRGRMSGRPISNAVTANVVKQFENNHWKKCLDDNAVALLNDLEQEKRGLENNFSQRVSGTDASSVLDHNIDADLRCYLAIQMMATQSYESKLVSKKLSNYYIGRIRGRLSEDSLESILSKDTFLSVQENFSTEGLRCMETGLADFGKDSNEILEASMALIP
jgi:hypothetical protein